MIGAIVTCLIHVWYFAPNPNSENPKIVYKTEWVKGPITWVHENYFIVDFSDEIKEKGYSGDYFNYKVEKWKCK